MTLKSPIINVASMTPQEMGQYVIDELRSRLNNSFLQVPISEGAVHGMKHMIHEVIKSMERTGRIRPPLTDKDIEGVTEILLLEWSVPNYGGPRVRDSEGYTIPVSAPDVRAICGGLSDQAIRAMTAPYSEFAECKNVARFFFLEKLRRDGAIDGWHFTWTNAGTRSGDLHILPSLPVSFIKVDIKVDL